ncbi:MAG: hypothetical protein ACLFRV_06040 [Acidimicrobiales bacterium]
MSASTNAPIVSTRCSRRWSLGASLVAALLVAASLLAGCSGDGQADLGSIAEETFSEESVWQGDDRYLSVTLRDGDFVHVVELDVYLEQLGFSPAVSERMGRTRALDGTQSAHGDGVNVTWTYHPDNGLQAVFEREE